MTDFTSLNAIKRSNNDRNHKHNSLKYKSMTSVQGTRSARLQPIHKSQAAYSCNHGNR